MSDFNPRLGRGLDLTLRTLIALAALCVVGATVATVVTLAVVVPSISDNLESELDEARDDIVRDARESMEQALEPTRDDINELRETLSSDLDDVETTMRVETQTLDDSLSTELMLVQSSSDETVRLLDEINRRDALAVAGPGSVQQLVAAPPRALYGVRVGVGYEAFADPELGWLSHAWINPDRLPAAGRGGWPDLHLLCRHAENNGAGSLSIWITTEEDARVDHDALTVSWRAAGGLPRVAAWHRIAPSSDDEFAFALDKSLTDTFRNDLIGTDRLTMDIFVEDHTLLSYFSIDFLLDVPVAAHLFQCGS